MNRYKLSFSTAALFPRSVEKAMDLISKAGFDYIEYMPQCMEDCTPEFVKRLLKNRQINFSSLHFPVVFQNHFYSPYERLRKEVKEIIKDVVETASLLKAEIIVIHPPYFHRKTEKMVAEKYVIESLRFLCDVAMDKGITVVFENFPKGGATPKEIFNVIKEVNRDNFFPMLDISHAKKSHLDPLWMLKELYPVHIHASDFQSSEYGLPPGDGSFDWIEFKRVLDEVGYGGFIVVEPFFKHFLENPLERIKRILDFLLEIFG